MIKTENILNYEIINNISNSAFKKRIIRELNEISRNNLLINLEFDKKYNLIINLIENDNNVYTFMLNKDYPFRFPIVKYNYNYYKHSLHIYTPEFLDIFKKMTGKQCLCCTSILSGEYWSPTFTIEKIFKEIKETNQIKKNIIYKFYADKIINKYLLPYLSLDIYLF